MTRINVSLISAAAIVMALSAQAQAIDLNVGVNASAQASTQSEQSSSRTNAGAKSTVGLSTGTLFGSNDAGAVGGEIGTTANGAADGSADNGNAQSLGGAFSADAIIELIEQSDWNENSLSAMSSMDIASAYEISPWLDAGAQADLSATLTSHADDIEQLRASVAANAAIQSWLETQGMSGEDMIAAGVTADGSLVLFGLSGTGE